jgi:hypothetical protein
MVSPAVGVVARRPVRPCREVLQELVEVEIGDEYAA